MRGRPLVWIALVAALLSALYAFGRLDHLPEQSMTGRMTAVIAEVMEDRLLLRDVFVDGNEIDGNILMYSESCGCEMKPGMMVAAEVELRPLAAPVNPHGWDDRTWFITKGAVYTCSGALQQHSEDAPFSLRETLRGAFLAHIEALWPEENELITALLLGFDEGLSDEMQEAFRRSGAAHLMAVSGLHVGFVAALVMLVFRWMRKNSWGQILISMVCLSAYALLAESAFSVFRATVMLGSGLLARRFGRRPDGATSLAAAVLAALIMDPMEILRAGFLMSVCSVLGILMLNGRIEKALEKAVRIKYLRSVIAVSVSAQLGVLPVQVFLFGTMNLLSLLTNLAAVPLAAGIVMLGLPTVLLHMLLPSAAVIPGFVTGLMAKLLTAICETVSGIAFAQITVETPPVFVLLCFMGLLFLLSPYWMEFRKTWRLVLAVVMIGAFAGSLGLWLTGTGRTDEQSKAVFLSVGTADCAVLQSSEGSLLVDTGWSGSQAVRYLQGENLQLQAVILTHGDEDHAGGLAHVLENVPVGAVFVPEGMSREGMEDALAVAEEKEIPIVELHSCAYFTVGDYQIRVLSPEIVREGKENEDSLVLEVQNKGMTLLMMGDVTAETEARLGLPDCDILKVPHHGSASGTSDVLLRKTNPEAAVISVGTPNRYGFPREEVLERLEKADADIWRTDLHHAVTVVFEEDGYMISSYQPPELAQEWFGVKQEHDEKRFYPVRGMSFP